MPDKVAPHGKCINYEEVMRMLCNAYRGQIDEEWTQFSRVHPERHVHDGCRVESNDRTYCNQTIIHRQLLGASELQFSNALLFTYSVLGKYSVALAVHHKFYSASLVWLVNGLDDATTGVS